MRRSWTTIARVCAVAAVLACTLVSLGGTTPVGAASGSFVGLVPARLLETRVGVGLSTVDGQFQGVGVVGGGATLNLPVLSRGGVPAAGVGAVALNVTVTEPTAGSYVTVFPTGEPRPTASNLNMVVGQTVSNMVVVPVGAGGQISLFNLSGQTHVVVDVLGWFPSGASFGGLTPARLLETRVGAGMVTVDGQQQGVGALNADRTLDLPVLGRGGVPATGVGAVALNVTATEPTMGSFLTVFPAGALRPTASNLNMAIGTTVSNMVIVPVGVNGRVSIYNLAGTTQIVVDVLGWFPTADVIATTTTTSPPPTPFTRLVNAGTNGIATGGATGVAISANGRYVAFASPANNIVTNDTNPFTDVFVRDLQTNSVVRVSLAASGGNDDGNSVEPSISADGNRVAFHTNAALVPSDTNGVLDVYVHELSSGITIRVSTPNPGGTAGDSTWPAISGTGRYVAFNSVSDNLVLGDTNGHIDVFVRDLDTNTIERASVGGGGTQASGGFGSFDPDVSDDGNLVVFSSNETSLGGPDSTVRHIYVRNRAASTTTLVTRNVGNQPSAAGVAQDPSISADGAWVMFHSTMSDLVAGDTNNAEDVFRVSAAAGSLTRVGLLTDEGQGEGANSMINANGRYITFSSDFTGQREIYRYDADLVTTATFSVDTAGAPANGASRDSVISGDGRTIAFLSTATDLGGTVSGGTNVYVRFLP
jgi:Tol biopolymer transport system component